MLFADCIATHIHADKFDKMVNKITFWMYSTLCCVVVLAAAQDTCPTQWFTSQFTIVSDRVVDATLGDSLLDDRNGSFFREVLMFTETEIAQEMQTAREFISTTFGLTFPALDANGEARFENAVLSYYRFPFRQTVTLNRWIATGDTQSRCFNLFNGGIRVTFTGDQPLYGTYGGVNGLNASINSNILYGYYSIDACPQQPILIQYQSQIPGRPTPIDFFFVNYYRTYHPQLGIGTGVAAFRATPFNQMGTLLRSEFFATIVFPPPTPIVGLDN